jgi:hypothetical protein
MSGNTTFCDKCKQRVEPSIRNEYNGEIVGPDPCLGKLPGVVAACCGHGEDEGYIWFENGLCIRFDNMRTECGHTGIDRRVVYTPLET